MAGRTRRYDPDRRERLTEAAVRVVAERGVAGLTHRAVAAEAGVPLGSTTYHFSGRDELLVAALERVTGRWRERLERWLDGMDPARPPAEELARFVGECVGPGRERTQLEYELYVAALRHPAVRPVAARWYAETAELIRRRLPDEATARAVVALADGLTLQLLVTGAPFDAEQVSAAFARVLPGGGASSHGGGRTG
jgi:DNA-binding transcriptional regulator YbjK